MAGAPLGNQNAAKGNRWSTAIDAALANRSRKDQVDALEKLADKLIELGLAGDLSALKELGDRIDGKVAASLALSGSLAMKKAEDLTDDELAHIAANGSG